MKRFYEYPQKTSENRLPQRAYYIPGGEAEYTLLNGIWDFAFFENGDAVENVKKWDKTDVPSCWQMRGYENPNYTNINYPYPCDPPYVPDINPMGIYRRDFEIKDTTKLHYIVFEGISSCGELFINGEYVGFTTGSHLQSEFDITPFVKKGKNTVTVKVHKWCACSYIEDQDFFRFNGIFRDVYLLSRPKGHITDIAISTKGNSVNIITDRKTEVKLYYKNELLEAKLIDKKGSFTVKNKVMWNAEVPELYTLKFYCAGEEIVRKFGFRTVGVSKKRELLINGSPIKMRGINHHDTSAANGWCMTDAEIKRDLMLMKSLGINTIRTSHYPPSPAFLDYCDEMGFYVILETDLETHGMTRAIPNATYETAWTPQSFWPSEHPDWEGEFVSRMERAYERDKNHASIIMWSTGNESGHGPNHVKMIEYLRKTDTSRLIHCEDASRRGIYDNSDVYSRMYLSLDMLDECLNDPKITVPIMLCEYSHSMGNGPGDIYMYWEKILKNPAFVGGCIWEWADHTVKENGVCKYGGDFKGELTDDGNFCCDGLVFHDRSFKAGTMEVKAAYAPFRFELKQGTIKYTNRFDFLNTDKFGIRYVIKCDGDVIEDKTVKLSLKPHASGTIIPEKPFPTECRLGASVTVYLMDGGKDIAHLEQPIKCKLINDAPAETPCIPVKIKGGYVFAGDGFEYTFSEQYGNFTSIVIGGEEQLAAPVKLTAFRAPTDNDRHIKNQWIYSAAGWQGENLDREFHKTYDVSLKKANLCISGCLAGVSRRPVIKYESVISVSSDGKISYTLSGTVPEQAVFLPRLGYEFKLKKKNAAFRYFGYGPLETYRDMMHHATLGYFDSTAAKEYVPYVMPQEHGNHTGVKALDICSMSFACTAGMDINVSRYSAQQLYNAKHTDEIGESDATYLHIDYKNSGIGSNSCGPALLPEYAMNDKKFTFSFTLAAKK